MSTNKPWPFFSERVSRCPEGSATLFGRFPADRPKFRPGHGGDPQVKNPKNSIFSIFSKFVLDDSRYQIRLPNRSRTPKMSFSGHFLVFRTISATLRKIDFLIWKIPKVPMWAFCHFLRYEAIFCSMWLKIWNMFWNLFSRSQRYFWIPMRQAFDV